MSSNIKICRTHYGNVMCSRASVISLWIDQIRSGNPITFIESSITRFIISLDEAMNLVLFAFENGWNGRKLRLALFRVRRRLYASYLAEKKADIKVFGIRH